jgi:hypothetical protein
MESTPMKLLCAIAFALLPLAASAQTLNSSLLTGLCHDNYFEDTAGQCNTISADEVLTIEAILEKYGAIITRDTDDEIAVFFTDPEDIPVGSVQPWNESPTAEYPTRTDEESTADAVVKQSATSAQIITTESPALRGEAVFEADDVSITGPSAAHKPAVAAGAAEE